MAKTLTCPCGLRITARDDVFVEEVNNHLAAQHDGRTYPEDMVLAMATDVSDANLPD
jgi:hypothetical protein